MNNSQLTLTGGITFEGQSPEWQRDIAYGEVVFTTGMTSYVETLTDPSYAGQIITFTYPLIGNYGVPKKEDWESSKIHAAGVLVSEACTNWSHSDGEQSLLEWLQAEGVPIMTGIDTRALTKLIREKGALLGAIVPEEKKTETITFVDPNKKNLVAAVSPTEKRTYGSGSKVLMAVDCGMKENIVRELMKFDVTIHRVPYNYDYTNDTFDGIFISNGPGDPQMAEETIAILKKALSMQKPIFGICLGSQLLALAAGASTYKLPYGHRGQNQPVINTQTKQCMITSQNHGYAVDEQSLPTDWSVSFTNLNDESVEGIAHKSLPYWAVQFHPEAAPGPTDANHLFKQFIDLL